VRADPHYSKDKPRRDPPGVVNVRVAELRKPGRPGGAYHDLAAWLAASPDHVYCGRRVQHVPATYDSPFRNDVPRVTRMTQDMAVSAFEQRFRAKLATDPELVTRLVGLQGKTLGCWCKPKACHCDVVLKLSDEYSNPAGMVEDGEGSEVGDGVAGGAEAAGGAGDEEGWDGMWGEEDYGEYGGDFAVGGAAAPPGNRGGAGSAGRGRGHRKRIDGKESVYSAKHVRRKVGAASAKVA
jgi:hypothetical protein